MRRRRILTTGLAVASLLLVGVAPAQGARVPTAPGALAPVTVQSPREAEVSGTPQTWTAVRSGAPDSAAGFGFARARFVGPCVGEGSGPGCRPGDDQRVVYDFGDLAEADLADATTISATLTVPVTRVRGCGTQTVAAHLVTSPVTAATTWNALTARWGSPVATSAAAACDDARLSLDVSAAVRRAAQEGHPLSLGLRAVDEDCRGCGRVAVGPDATLTVRTALTDTVEALGTVLPSTECVTGEARPSVRSATPRLQARLSNEREPFPSSMSAVFTVRRLDTGETVWQSEPTPAQGSEALHQVVVPDGVLEHAAAYGWDAQAVLPSGRLTAPSSCELVVDTEAPQHEPGVTPVEGYPAVYREGVMSGAPGRTGAFVFDLNGSEGVAYLQYSFEGFLGEGAPQVQPGEVVEFTPTGPGQHQLVVRAVDAAGNVGPQRSYWILVAWPVAGGGFWRFDDLAGDVATDSLGNDDPLTLSGAAWTPGLGALHGDPSDGALLLDDAGDSAVSAESVVEAEGSVTVAGWFRPAVTGTGADVVSQQVAGVPGFALGETTDPACPTSSGTCWSFSVATGDGTERARVLADAEPEVGRWHFLAGVRNAATGSLSLYLCDGGTETEPGSFSPELVGSGTAVPLLASADGPLTVGGSAWRGAVDHLRVLDTAATGSNVVRWCNGS